MNIKIVSRTFVCMYIDFACEYPSYTKKINWFIVETKSTRSCEFCRSLNSIVLGSMMLSSRAIKKTSNRKIKINILIIRRNITIFLLSKTYNSDSQKILTDGYVFDGIRSLLSVVSYGKCVYRQKSCENCEIIRLF